MSAKTPQQVHGEFEKAFNRGDVEAVMALYEPEACIEPEPGQVVHGAAAVREVLLGFLALKGKIKMETLKVVECSNLAVLHANWTLNGTAPDGSALTLQGHTTEIVRKHSSGAWLYVIDLPDDV